MVSKLDLLHLIKEGIKITQILESKKSKKDLVLLVTNPFLLMMELKEKRDN